MLAVPFLESIGNSGNSGSSEKQYVLALRKIR